MTETKMHSFFETRCIYTLTLKTNRRKREVGKRHYIHVLLLR